MKTLERKQIGQIKAPKPMGRFATIEETSAYKTDIANKMLAKITNLNEFFNTDGTRK